MLLEETVKVNKVLCKFKTYRNTKTNELFSAGPVFVTNSLRVKTNNAVERKKPVWRSRLKKLRLKIKD